MTDILLSSSNDERHVAKANLDAAEEGLQALCSANASIFVEVDRRGKRVSLLLKNLEACVSQVEGDAEVAQVKLDQNDHDSSLAELSERHRIRRRCLLNHAALIELLELPSLMDACMRSDLFEEALNIAGFSNTLERRHQDSNHVVSTVVKQMRSRQEDLRQYLLYRLKSSVTMPECLELVTALRRLNSIDLERQSETDLEGLHEQLEQKLRIDFLEARDVWLDSRSSTTPEDFSATIERHRTRLFEIATQFNSIFRVDASSQKPSTSLLAVWMTRRTTRFLGLLRDHLDTISGASTLHDILGATVFFSTSLGRLGADFTAQFAGLFENRMFSMVVSFWDDGVLQLRQTLKICREAGVASPLSSGVIEEGQDSTSTSRAPGEPLIPPKMLLSVPPLARLVNAVLTGLNELRRCLFPGIVVRLRLKLRKVLSDVKHELNSHDRAVMKPGMRGEAQKLREIASKYLELFDGVVDTYLLGSLESAVGDVDAAEGFYFEFQKKIDDMFKPKDEEGQTEKAEESVDAAAPNIDQDDDHQALEQEECAGDDSREEKLE